jgi:hypothetical protein
MLQVAGIIVAASGSASDSRRRSQLENLREAATDASAGKQTVA